jgi:hypothetical protein
MGLPKFVGSGKSVTKPGQFLSWEPGETKEIVLLTGLEHPEGEEQTGKNCIIHFDQYSIWIDQSELPEGTKSPMFPKIGVPDEPGKMLGLESRFRAMALVMDAETQEEKIWAMTKSVFDQLEPIEDATGESLRGALVRVTRKGKKLDTRYTVTFTGKRFELEGEPELDVIEWIGPTSREEQIRMLESVGVWPPGGSEDTDSDGAPYE